MRTALRSAYWLGVWLLSPSRGALLLKCTLIGVVLKLLSLLVTLPLLLLTTDADGPAAGFGYGQLEALNALLVAPVLETAAMAAVFGGMAVLFGDRPLIPAALVVAGAALLHGNDPVTRGFVVFMFAALSIQYARFRAVMGLVPAMSSVAVTHATVNMLGLAVGLVYAA